MYLREHIINFHTTFKYTKGTSKTRICKSELMMMFKICMPKNALYNLWYIKSVSCFLRNCWNMVFLISNNNPCYCRKWMQQLLEILPVTSGILVWYGRSIENPFLFLPWHWVCAYLGFYTYYISNFSFKIEYLVARIIKTESIFPELISKMIKYLVQAIPTNQYLLLDGKKVETVNGLTPGLSLALSWLHILFHLLFCISCQSIIFLNCTC